MTGLEILKVFGVFCEKTYSVFVRLMHMGVMAVIGATGPKNLVHVVINIGARDDLGRPTTTAKENKENFMATLYHDSGPI